MAVPYGEVPRDDAAAVLAELVHMPRIKQIILELTSGDTAVCAALAGAVDGAI
jgi:hypothetical protein